MNIHVTLFKTPAGYLQAWSRIWTCIFLETNPGSGHSGLKPWTTGFLVRNADLWSASEHSFKILLIGHPENIDVFAITFSNSRL